MRRKDIFGGVVHTRLSSARGKGVKQNEKKKRAYHAVNLPAINLKRNQTGRYPDERLYCERKDSNLKGSHEMHHVKVILTFGHIKG
jgi:hypothetical protein